MTATASLDTIAEQIRAGELEEAGRALDAIELTDDLREEVLFLRGYLAEMSYEREKALEYYEEVLHDDPEHMEAAFRAALLYDQAGDEGAAVQLYEQCTTKTPAPLQAMVNLAVLYEDQGRLRDSEALLKHILSQYPDHSRAKKLLKSVESSYTMVYDELTQREREKRDAILDTPISDFELGVRSRNCLRQMNIRTLGDLLRTTEAELLAYKNFGETSLNEIKAMLANRGLRLGQGAPEATAPATPQMDSLPPAASPHVNRSVSELELSVRSRKALQRLGITTIGELAMRSEAELLSIKNFGQTSLSEIQRQLTQFGLSLRESE